MKKNKLQLYWEHRYNVFLASKGVEEPRAELSLFMAEFIESIENEALDGDILDLTTGELVDEW